MINILDKGYIVLVDSMGDDDTPAKTARTSYNDANKNFSKERNAGLTDYLIRHKHNTPVEFIELLFYIKMPIFVARQMIRTRTASVNEISYRYVQATREYYLPEESRMQKQSEDNKQGSSSELVDYPRECLKLIEDSCNNSFDTYERLVANGLNLETARTVLPLGTYTEWYWKIDMHNLLHFLKLRLDKHAQYEIRVYAQAMYDMVKEKYPTVIRSWEKHILNSTTFSSEELDCFSVPVPVTVDHLKGSAKKEMIEKLEKAFEDIDYLQYTPIDTYILYFTWEFILSEQQKPFWADITYVSTVEQIAKITIKVEEPYDVNDPITLRQAAETAAKKKAVNFAFNEELLQLSNFNLKEIEIGVFYGDDDGEPDEDYIFKVDEAGSWSRG